VATFFSSDFEGGSPFSGWDVTPATVTQDTSIFHAGAASAKHDSTLALFPRLGKTIAGAPTLIVAQEWFYIPSSVPGGLLSQVCRVRCSFFSVYLRIDTTALTAEMVMDDGSIQPSQSGSYTVDTWTRLTMRVNVGVNPMLTDWNLGTTEQTQVSYPGGTTDVQEFLDGSSDLASGLITYSDDVLLGNASGDYEAYLADSSEVLMPRHAIGMGRW
jgi:hypothetical protein